MSLTETHSILRRLNIMNTALDHTFGRLYQNCIRQFRNRTERLSLNPMSGTSGVTYPDEWYLAR